MIKFREELKTPVEMGRVAVPYMPTAVMSEHSSPDSAGFPYSTRYELRARVGVMFTANSAEYERARENAERLLLSIVYAEVLDAIALATSAASAGDFHATCDILQSLRRELVTP
jgi:hypothetical protein